MVLLDSACRERIHVWVLTLWSLHGARKSNQIRTIARILDHSKKLEPPSHTEIEGEIHWSQKIPSGMQPGLLSSSHCGRWMGAHQWLAELISLTEHKRFHTTGVVAWRCRLKVFSAGLLLTLLIHDRGFTDLSFIPAVIQVKIQLNSSLLLFTLTL